jgi:ketosteroid isomerase-like protein
MRASVLPLGLILALCTLAARRTPEISSVREFQAVLHNLAEAWNNGESRRAAECFTEDAIYTEPPDKQVYRGREALFRFFGGGTGRPGQMTMRWHHLAFDPATQIGFGEFSFTYGTTVHGVAVIRLRQGKIANWREYWYESTLPWDQFIRANPF